MFSVFTRMPDPTLPIYDLPIDKVVGASGNSSKIDLINGDHILNYLDGLFTSVGSENQINRDYNSAEALAQRQWASKEAEIERQWYSDQSNSAFTRRMQDLKAAGLNPILAYAQGGAAASSTVVPSGSASSYQHSGGDTATSLVNAIANVISALKGNSASKLASFFKK